MAPRRSVFRIKVYNGPKVCPSLLETVRRLVPTLKLRDITLFHIQSKRRSFPSARCASADNATFAKILDIQTKIFFAWWVMGLIILTSRYTGFCYFRIINIINIIIFSSLWVQIVVSYLLKLLPPPLLLALLVCCVNAHFNLTLFVFSFCLP